MFWPFRKKKPEISKAQSIPDSSKEDKTGQEGREPEINYQEYIARLRLMKLFSKFSTSVGKQVFIILPDTNSALCTIIEEVFIAINDCYFTVSASLQNLQTGGGYTSFGCREKSKINGNRIYFDTTGFFYLCDAGDRRVHVEIETVISAMLERYQEQLDGKINTYQSYIDNK